MSIVIEEMYLPATLTAPPMTDEQFMEFCSAYPDYFIEVTADGEILIMPPTHSLTGVRNGNIAFQLGGWARADRRGAVTDAASGFVLPNGARRSPDAAWTAKDRLRDLDPASLNGFWHLCPDFAIELRSTSDRLAKLRAKMQEYIDNGTKLGWLIDPQRRVVEIYRPGTNPEIRANIDSIAAEAPLEGFVLDLRPIWEPLSF